LAESDCGRSSKVTIIPDHTPPFDPGADRRFRRKLPALEDIAPVRRCERNGEEFIGVEPSQRCMFEALGLAFDFRAQERNHEVRPWVLFREFDRACTDYLHSQFFREFSMSRVEIALSGINLPARKFPEPPMPLVGWALAEQESVPSLNYNGNNSDHISSQHG
jgi:hypothetical protein